MQLTDFLLKGFKKKRCDGDRHRAESASAVRGLQIVTPSKWRGVNAADQGRLSKSLKIKRR